MYVVTLYTNEYAVLSEHTFDTLEEAELFVSKNQRFPHLITEIEEEQ